MGLDPARGGFPARISEWTLSRAIGSGATSRVFLGERPAIGRHAKVAVKLLRPELARSSSAAVELFEEAKLLATLRHPNLTELVAAGEVNGVVYLVLEYIEGTTLAELLSRGRLPDGVVARVITDSLRGLHAAHEHRTPGGAHADLVHRDFAPQNILVGVDGATRLTDFGIAKAMGRLSVTRTGIVKGKARYMSPEQACGEPLDRRSDVWAAGVVVWEALAGRALLPESGELAVLERIISDEAMPRLSSVRPDLRAELDAVVSAALHKDPARRPASADELRRQLTRAFSELAPVAELHEVAALVRDVIATRQPEPVPEPEPEPESEPPTVATAPPRSRTLPLALGSIGLGALLVAALSWPSGAEPAARLERGFRSPASRLVSPRAVSSPAPATLTVQANAPIRSLSIDGLALPLSAPATEVTLSWTPGSEPAHVKARSLDGRSASAELPPSARTLRIRFEDGATPRVVQKQPRESAISNIPLAPTPYPRR